jgi:hypothetical protein
MSIDSQQISYIYTLIDEGNASAAAGEIELLKIVPIPSFGQGLLPRLLFAAERRSEGEQIEILRTFLDRLTAEFTSVEEQALGESEHGDADPSHFFELHERFFEIWRGTLDDAQTEAEHGARTPVLSALSGALATIWRPALYDEWGTKGSLLPVWGRGAEILQPLLLNISHESSPAARAEELDAFAACALGLYQGRDTQEQILKTLSETVLQKRQRNRADLLWRAALISPARWEMNHSIYLRSQRYLIAAEAPRGPSLDARRVERPALTVAYPEAVVPGAWTHMEMFLYLRMYQYIVDREIQKLQQVQGSVYENVKTYLSNTIPEGTKIHISVSSEDFDINPDEISIKWFEEYYRFPFRIRLRRELKLEDEANINIQVSADDIPLGELIVGTSITAGSVTPKFSAAHMQWYSEVFASYAHEDIAVVQHLRQQYEALGMTLFVDKYVLRPGVDWDPELLRLISQSDIFQLFWSSAASQSKYVKLEWQHALELLPIKGAAFIRPVFWQSPMPSPPTELSALHFRYIAP